MQLFAINELMQLKPSMHRTLALRATAGDFERWTKPLRGRLN